MVDPPVTRSVLWNVVLGVALVQVFSLILVLCVNS
jgi:hypothetical protein